MLLFLTRHILLLGIRLFLSAICLLPAALSTKNRFTKVFYPVGALLADFDARFGPIDGATIDDNKEVTIMMATSQYKDNIANCGENCMSMCPKKCRLVNYANSPHEMLTANALIFHPTFYDFDNKLKIWLSARRRQKQIFIFFSEEPPEILTQMLHNGDKTFHMFNGFFNWTATFRQDSDVFLPYRLIGYEPIPENELPPPKQPWVKIGNKRHIAALVSNCHSQNYDRVGILNELADLGLQVDIYGKCGPYKCSVGVGCNMDYFQEHYLFYASFENSICTDYFTEKMANIFAINSTMVPLVVGGADYEDLLPPKSFINLRQFRSQVVFAQFLMTLAKNETEYNSYFQWKSEYRVKWLRHNKFCSVCEKLHMTPLDGSRTSVYDDLDGWFRVPCAGKQNVYVGTRG